MKKWIIALVIVGLAGYAVYDFVIASPSNQTSDVENSSSGEKEIGIEQGDMAPDFELETLDGGSLLLSELQGEKVLLNFWATWCPPCRVEIPDIQKFHENYDDVKIVAINMTESESDMGVVPAFVDDYDMTFDVVLDTESITSLKYDVVSLPTSYLLNTDGTIHQKFIGPLNYELMEEQFMEMY